MTPFSSISALDICWSLISKINSVMFTCREIIILMHGWVYFQIIGI